MNVIGIGTDIVETLRIAQMIERHGELFLIRVYTPHEIEYCSERKAANAALRRPLGGQRSRAQGPGHRLDAGHRWRDIEVRNEVGGRPLIVLDGGALEVSQRLGIDRSLDQHLPLPQPRHRLRPRPGHPAARRLAWTGDRWRRVPAFRGARRAVRLGDTCVRAAERPQQNLLARKVPPL